MVGEGQVEVALVLDGGNTDVLGQDLRQLGADRTEQGTVQAGESGSRDELSGAYRGGASLAEKSGKVAQWGSGWCGVDQAAVSDQIEPGLGTGDGDVEQAYPVALPGIALPGGARHPPLVVFVFDQVEDHDGEFPALEAVRGANLGDRGSRALLVAEGFQGRLDLQSVRGDYGGAFLAGVVVLGQDAAE